jgi:hypothetical protein
MATGMEDVSVAEKDGEEEGVEDQRACKVTAQVLGWWVAS